MIPSASPTSSVSVDPAVRHGAENGITAQQQTPHIDPHLTSGPPQVQSLTNVLASPALRGSIHPRRRHLPQEIFDPIASYLAPKYRVAMGSASRFMWQAVSPQIDSARIAHSASQVNTLTEFQIQLEAIRMLRITLQPEPLIPLGLRIHALPEAGDRVQASIDFRSVALGLGDKYCTPEVAELARIAAYPHAPDAARAGENIVAVAKFHGITMPDGIAELERVAIEAFAEAEVRKGTSVQVLAQRHGITSQHNINVLERAAVETVAGAAVRAGESVLVVAQRYGITRPSNVSSLEWRAVRSVAGAAVKGGLPVKVVADRYGITGAGSIKQLQRISRSTGVT
jgi:hypothetical protein